MKRTHFYHLPGKALSIGLAAFVLLAAGCDNGNNENTEPKSIKITGMGTAGTGGFMVGMFSTMPEAGEPENEITGFGYSSNGEVIIDLKVGPNPQTGQAWTGTGSYWTCSITRLVISQASQFLAPTLRSGAAKLHF